MSYAVILLSALRGSSYKLSQVCFFEYWNSLFLSCCADIGNPRRAYFFPYMFSYVLFSL